MTGDPFWSVHSLDCGCWECEGREPDAQNVDMNVTVGRCANCGEYVSRGEPFNGTTHSGRCGNEYAAWLNSRGREDYGY